MVYLKNSLAVGLGAFGGGICRLLIGQLITSTFPLSTLIVNLCGCFLLTYFTVLTDQSLHLPKAVILLIGTGFLGAFTTFSSFTLDALHLLQSGHLLSWLIYSLSSMVGGIIGAGSGYLLASKRGKADE